MKDETKKVNKGIFVGCISFVVVVVLFAFFLLFDFSDFGKTTENYETSQYKQYLTGLKEYASNMDRSMSIEEAETDFLEKVQEYGKTYDDGSGTGYANTVLTNAITGNSTSDTGSFLDDLLGILDSLLDTGFISGSSSLSKVVSLKSYTVCETVGGTYCLGDEGLSAKVYLSDSGSTKWAILLHGVNMNGKQIYSSLGEMYTSQGYNVLAPDLRGAGDSDGSVAMGYLESLDVYDWIKDLNANYSRYGVNKKPETIIVHGVSLGGATTLQLATNPDIAAASGGVYSANLTDLNVKGFVDDCGYTSMSGIITGMLSLGDSSQSTALLGGFDIDVSGFMSELQKGINDLNIGGFTDINIGDVTNGAGLSDYLKQFSDKFNEFIEEKSEYQYFETNDQVQLPDVDLNYDTIIDWWNQFNIKPTVYNGKDDSTASFTGNIFDVDVSSLLDNLIPKLLIEFAGIGLTEENYDKYSNAFYPGRTIPSGSKVVIIHGDSDTMVPPSNANIVQANIGNAELLYRWDVAGAPHAFIVVGSNETEYTNLIGNFANCVADGACSAFDGSDMPLQSIVK